MSHHIFTEWCAHQAECPSIHLNVVKLRAHEFDCIARLKECELFSLTLSQVDAFLSCTSSHYTSVSPQSSDRHLNLENPYPYVRTQPQTYDQDHCLTLHQMKKELHLSATITPEELEAYQQSKNIDSATLLPEWYQEYLHVFLKKETDTLLKHEPQNHAIHLKEGAQAPASVLYNMSHNEAQELCHYLDENLSKEFIWVSHSESAAPVLFVKKPEGGLHFCVDYRGLNAVTVKN